VRKEREETRGAPLLVLPPFETRPPHFSSQAVDSAGDSPRKLATSPLSTAQVTALAGGSPPPPDTSCVGVELKTPVAPGATWGVATSAVFTRALVPLPAVRSQADPHRLAFNASHLLLSPYPVSNQTLTVDLPCTSKGLLAATPRQPMADDGQGVLTFGPFEATASPWSASPLFLHFTDDSPAPRAIALEREVTVSHWGNVAVDEAFDLTNDGAALVGGWSRYDFDTAPRATGKGAALVALTGTLPKAARWVYFKDSIGNVSSSSVKPSRSRLDVRLEPRFPLAPGWRTTFKFGYSLPLAVVAGREGKAGGRVRVTVPLGTPLTGVSADLLSTTVILPEGASAIRVDTPFGSDGTVTLSTGTRATTLDTVGRLTVTATVRNAVGEHMAAPLVVTYALHPLRPFVEPFMLVAAFGALFGVAMLARRTDVSLGGGEGKVKGA